MTRGKILRIKQGYNPNSSSIGSETTGAVAGLLQTGSEKLSTVSFIRYTLGVIIGIIVVCFVARKFYYIIKYRAKKNEGKV